jgi:two-component system chemotaxis response regulator CheY
MSGNDLQDLSFLVVDDDKNFLNAMELQLRSLGARRLTCAQTGSEALSRLANAREPFDVMLCDFDMPHGNGLQLLKALRSGRIMTVRSDMCFIIVSGFSQPALVRTAGALNASGYLVKPLDRQRLRAAIHKGRAKNFAVKPAVYDAIVVPESAQGLLPA